MGYVMDYYLITGRWIALIVH